MHLDVYMYTSRCTGKNSDLPDLLCAASHSWEVSAIQKWVHLHHCLCCLPVKHLLAHLQLGEHQVLWLVRVSAWEAVAFALGLLLSLQELEQALKIGEAKVYYCSCCCGLAQQHASRS